MSEKVPPRLSGVPETLLITLYARAVESQRTDALIRDEKAVEMVRRIECDFSRLRLRGHDAVAVILRMREFDRFTREFLNRNPDACVVHIGCGLDARFDRVDNGRVEWFDLDLPAVVELRQKLLFNEEPRYHILEGSILEDGWVDRVGGHRPRSFLFLAEGVLPYFKEAQVRSLFLRIRDQFPGAELVCDAMTPLAVRLNNLHLAFSKIGARLFWQLKRGEEVESWGEGIKMLAEWYYFDHPEPRLRGIRWMRHFPLLARSGGIFHYRIG